MLIFLSAFIGLMSTIITLGFLTKLYYFMIPSDAIVCMLNMIIQISFEIASAVTFHQSHLFRNRETLSIALYAVIIFMTFYALFMLYR